MNNHGVKESKKNVLKKIVGHTYGNIHAFMRNKQMYLLNVYAFN